MIRSTFSIIDNIKYDSKGHFQSCFADQARSFHITFSGSNVVSIEGIEPKDLYARVLLCWSDGLSTIFVVLKNNKIYNIDNFDRTGKHKMIEYMVKNSKFLSDFESIDDIEVFSKL